MVEKTKFDIPPMTISKMFIEKQFLIWINKLPVECE